LRSRSAARSPAVKASPLRTPGCPAQRWDLSRCDLPLIVTTYELTRSPDPGRRSSVGRPPDLRRWARTISSTPKPAPASAPARRAPRAVVLCWVRAPNAVPMDVDVRARRTSFRRCSPTPRSPGSPGGGRTVIGEQSGARSQLGTEHLFPTNSTAVAAFRLAEGTEQVDTRRCRTSHSGATVRP